MNSFNVVKVVEYVNKIVENVRCATCDKLEGSRVRYPCGHTGCEECVLYTECCLICSPSSYDAGARPDQQWTLIVKHAITLLETCHKLFGPEAFQYKRLSEQLKIEKEVFPQCIQAPVKYENRRKSTKLSLDEKENKNSTTLPGETVSSKHNRMENSVIYVQQWLNRNEKNIARKPFADLNINTQRINNFKNKTVIQNRTENEIPLKYNRKRSHFKFIAKDSFFTNDKKSTYECGITSKIAKKEECKVIPKIVQKELSCMGDAQKVIDNDESGIFMDNEPVVIDDIHNTHVDKDQQAWLAVLGVHNRDQESTCVPPSQQYSTTDNKQIISTAYDIHKFRRVPFYKCSAIYDTYSLSKNETNSDLVPAPAPAKPVVITVDGEATLTTITVFRNVQNVKKNERTTNSVCVQTDIDHVSTSDSIEEGECDSNMEGDTHSEDLFADDRDIIQEIGAACSRDKSKGVVIAESDSDTDLQVSGPLSVQADVHRSCQEIDYGILTDIVNMKEHESKCRRAPRGHTPTSTDSSEKENFNPNRMKRRTLSKKKSMKK